MSRLRVLLGIACAAATLTALWLAGPTAGAKGNDVPHRELARVRAATARFHDVDAAVAAGYELLDVCAESEAGGMGYHYLKGVNDTVVDALAPESLVFEATDHGLRLVAVEYIVPMALSSTPPELLGQTFHANTDLGLWVLHAWIWEPNPAGMFADYNPNVPQCPDES